MSDWADEAAAKIIFDLATRYPTDGFGRMPCAVIADALRSRITALEAELAAEKADNAKMERHINELTEKMHAKCACSLDRPGDVCSGHAPLLRRAEEALDAEKAKVAKLREALASAHVVIDYAAQRLWNGRSDAIATRPAHIDEALRTARRIHEETA